CIQLGQGHIFSAFLRDTTERKQAEALLRRLPGQILTAQETERKRVARELHDSVNQILCSVKISILSLEQKLSCHDREAWKAAIQTKELLEGCIEEVRRIAHNLMPSELEDLGLVPALRSLCRDFRL